MATMDIAIDIGTSFTSIYLSGAGVVLREPTVLAYIGDGDGKKDILAVGSKAVQMHGKSPEKTRVVFPVVDGYIADPESCTLVMTEFIKRVLPDGYLFFPRIRAVLAVPTGLSVEERKVYEDVVRAAGVAEVNMIDNVICAALGFDLPVSSAAGGLVAVIGGGVTEIALISLLGTISGCSVNVGGNMMDRALADFIMGKYGLKIGSRTARRIKEETGSLYPNDISSIEVKGVNVNTMNPSSLTVYATDCYEALVPYYLRIAEAIEGVVNLCPPELASDVHDMGLFLAGGSAKIAGLERIMRDALGIPVTICEDPEYCAIVGAGKILGDKALLKKINAQQ